VYTDPTGPPLWVASLPNDEAFLGTAPRIFVVEMKTGSTLSGESRVPPEAGALDFESIVAAMAEGVIQQDSSGRVVYHNAGAARILGEPVEASFRDAFQPPRDHTSHDPGESRPISEHPAAAVLRTGKPCTGVIMGLRRAGEAITWIVVNSMPLRKEGEERPSGVVSSISDITGWYREELALRAREKVFRLLVENQNEGIGIVDLDERFLLTNHAGDEIFGVPPGGLAGRSLRDFLAPEGQSLVAEQTASRLEGRRSQYQLEIIRERDGVRRTILISAAPQFDDAGNVSGTVGVFSDITDRIYVERALQENEARLRLTFDKAPIGAAMVGLDCRYIQVNEAFCRMLGYAESELIGKSAYEVTHPDHHAAAEQFMGRLAQGEPVTEIETEKRYIRKDGGVVWGHLTVTLLKHGPIQRPYLLVMVEDITGRKMAEIEAARLQAQFLQVQKMESIGRLAGGIAHDFNNLLTVINGYSVSALEGLKPHDPLHGKIHEVYKAGERAAALVRQLLAFSRKQVLKPDLIDLNEMIVDMGRMLRPLVGEDIEIVTSLAPTLDPVLADRHQMEQVIMNLTVNARDAMPYGGRLSFETERIVLEGPGPGTGTDLRPGRYVRISIRDNGTGISDDVRQHLFEPFFTTKSVGYGTGLGLATVHGIVLQSGGQIEVETSAGVGTCFHVYLPASSGIVPAAVSPALDPAFRTQPASGSETILLVEDEAGVRRFVATLLSGCGYGVIESADGEDALTKCATANPDLLLTDVVMPKMSGTELAARALSAKPGLRVLFMSGYSDEVLSWPNDTSRGTAFIQKPFTPNELTTKVRDVLAGRREKSRGAAALHQDNLE
jgi:two-component system, cell cycle sensor histidine kinase and response regulator CckA